MAQELYDMYGCFPGAHAQGQPLYGSGNALRLNPHLRLMVEKVFAAPLRLSENTEEAACGAAYFAAHPPLPTSPSLS